jgi:hypothetical protein
MSSPGWDALAETGCRHKVCAHSCMLSALKSVLHMVAYCGLMGTASIDVSSFGTMLLCSVTACQEGSSMLIGWAHQLQYTAPGGANQTHTPFTGFKS